MSKSYGMGKQGEEIACKYLEKNNYKILDKNFNLRTGEIDIIAIDKQEIVFIEVKTRTNNKYGMPAEAVTMEKLNKIYKTANSYIYKRNLYNISARIDVVEVFVDKNKQRIKHLKNVLW